MWPFGKSNKQIEKNEPPVEDLKADNLDLVDMALMNSISDKIGNSITKAFNLNDFQMSDDFRDNDGYFGQEFDLRATAGKIKGLYSKEPWVYATAYLIARTLSSIDFNVINIETGEPDEKHPLNNQLKAGNQLQDNRSMNMAGYLDLALGGNYVIVWDEKFTVPMHVPIELVNLKLNDKQQMLSKNNEGPIKSIEITSAFIDGKAKSEIEYKYVIHHKLANPYNPFLGMSMFTAASRAILLDRQKNEFELAFYLRGAVHSGCIETTEDITKTRMERLMRTFEQSFTGKRNWWRVLFLPKGAKWINSGLTMTEMEHLEGMRENRRTLLAVLGIPPSQIGIVEDVNRATAEVQEAVFWRNTIVPLAQFIAAGWNNSYLVKTIYDGKVRVEPDFSSVEAIAGSIENRGQRAQAAERVLTVNELRTDIMGYPPLKSTDPRGNMFVAEIRPQMTNPFGVVTTPNPDDIGPENTEEQPTEEPTEDTETLSMVAHIKKAATENQERLEKTQSKKYLAALEQYLELIIDQAKTAILNRSNVRTTLNVKSDERTDLYLNLAIPVLIETMERAFIIGTTTTKKLTYSQIKNVTIKQTRFNQTDEQAIDAIRERTRDNQRRILTDRSLTRFAAFDEGQTEVIMQIIENGMSEGKTMEEIAANLREEWVSLSRGHSFTIARTEVLTSTSEGLVWNQNVLKEVFTEVNKQWIHTGDVGTNPDARKEHADFEKAGKNGIVPSTYEWRNPSTGATLRFPRDPQAGAKDVINCRCTMVNTIPDTAHSNAEAILETI